jgi:protein SCO1/2
VADRIQPLFITVDPERDTLEALRAYTAYFHPRLIGLTGPPEMIARTADVFHVRYEKVLTEGRDPDKYAVDHTSSLFLLGPDGKFVAKFAHGLPAADLADRLGEIIGD